MKWTPEQEAAIYTSGKDVLVSAAAGSGKTAVLVERIIQKVLNKENPLNIDSLLVVTFTNAAAQEMRYRVGLALENALQTEPHSHHLQKQLSLLQRASISTLHSFCMEIVREHAYLLEIDPAFRIANDLEADLLKQDVIDELFEEKYGATNGTAERFFAVVDRFSSDRSDVEIENLILQLYTFARQHPWPYEWLDRLVETYEVSHKTAETEFAWLDVLKQHVDTQLLAMEQELQLANEIARESDGPFHYLETIEADLQLLNGGKACQSWDELQSFMEQSTFKRLSSRRVECNKDKQTFVKQLRDRYRKRWNDLKKSLFTRDLASHMADMQQLAPIIKELSELVKAFDKRYTALKRENGLVDFLDLEHYSLQILLDESSTNDCLVPSNIAQQYKQSFAEVLVDEYQDTNLVQETILNLLTDQTGSGNMFMVGDVKQSIYRFRHAEPSLFIKKYHEFAKETSSGERIDLARNFRSREHILTATNYIFRQILDEHVGEVNYDQEAELVYGNQMYDSYPLIDKEPELLLIDRDPEQSEQETDEDFQDLQTAQLEARAYAKKINTWIGKNGDEPLQIVAKETDHQRNVQYRDIVILLRSLSWAPVIVDEFKKQGIPVYADLKTGYFAAIEIKVVLSLLKVIDNPQQDIPLAAVLRSPIVGLNEDELTRIRLAAKDGSYYDALKVFVKNDTSNTAKVVQSFLKQLEKFRFLARQGALSDLIWAIFRETGYYDFVGGMPGGRQRQANLRALYDRAKGYETTSFRGLFRFLRFIEWMEERGEDLGAARALSEQEDVVRITTIHSSKGLEFPIVIVGGLARQFNLQDLNKKHLLHKDLGFASKFIDPMKRITYPTLFYHATKTKLLQEQLAEEMRVLYVALTRAKEKLVLVASVRSCAKEIEKWQDVIAHPNWLLPDHLRMDARTYLDWIGPALVRHHMNNCLRIEQELPKTIPYEIVHDESTWKVNIIHAEQLTDLAETLKSKDKFNLEKGIASWTPLPLNDPSLDKQVDQRLSFRYKYEEAVHARAKQSVTEIKRHSELRDEYSDEQMIQQFQTSVYKRPQFMQAKKTFSPAEIGTAMHTVMQHLPLTKPLTKEDIQQYLEQYVRQEIITEELKKVIQIEAIEQFYQSDLANYMFQQSTIHREVPFSLSLPASEIYPTWENDVDEYVLIQGVIDCLIPKADGWIILDYKTDAIYEPVDDQLVNKLSDRYRVQMNLYKRAIETIWRQPVKEIYLYFFNRSLTIKMPTD